MSWLGFSPPRSLGRAETGGRAALPIWIEYMETALQGQPEVKRPMPEGISTVQLDDKTEYHYSEYPPPSPYPPSSEPVEEAPPPNDMTEDPFYDLIQQRRQGAQRVAHASLPGNGERGLKRKSAEDLPQAAPASLPGNGERGLKRFGR